MITERKTADAALGGRTARACDCCLIKRARWFCAADDAFLCQACDTSVHSANQLASRHERVRLQTSSFKAIDSKADGNYVPSWHQGFTRKARTPRHGKPTSMANPEKQEEALMANNPLPALVPEIGSEGTSPADEENEEQLLYRVPVFDPFDAELCRPCVPNEINNTQADEGADENGIGIELNALLNDDDDEADVNIPEFLGSDMELAEFAADVETFLSTGLDEAPCEDINTEGLGDANSEQRKVLEVCFDGAKVKVEDEDDQEVQAVIACHLDPAIDMAREALSWDFDYCTSHVNGVEEDQEEQKIKVSVEKTMVLSDVSKAEVERRMLLRLNYEAVMAAWDSHGGSPWTNGIRPDFNPNGLWPDILGLYIGENHHHHPYEKKEHGRAHGGGREARVSRYREKRRTRLFSKKIRYEVRKLNAEQRPRIKGRFVKRTVTAGLTFPYL